MITWILVTIVWVILLLKFREDSLFLQVGATRDGSCSLSKKFVILLLLLALGEATFQFFELLSLNEYGEVGYFVPFARAFLGVTKSVIGQLTLFFVSIGYGVVWYVHLTLGRAKVLISSELSPASSIYIVAGTVGLFLCSIAQVTLKVLEIDFYIQVLTTLTLEVIQLPALFFYVMSVGWVSASAQNPLILF